MNSEPQTQANPDNPSGDGWRDVEVGGEDLQQRLNAALKSNSELEYVVERQYELLRAAKQRNAELQCIVSQAEQQKQRHELTRRFALALAAASWTDPHRVWELAAKLADAEPRPDAG